MKFDCHICGGAIELPDDFQQARLVCPNCGREIAAPDREERETAKVPEDAEAGAGEDAHVRAGAEERVPSAPTTPAEFVAQMEAKSTHGKMVFGIVLVVGLLVGAALFFYLVPLSTVTSFFSELSAKRERGKLYAKVGLLPTGYYRSASLPGLRAGAGGGGKWDAPGEGNTYLVVDAEIAPRHFLPSDENYELIKKQTERKRARDPKAEVPVRERCRFFDPKRFSLITEGLPPPRGKLININFGVHKGFYDMFQMVVPEVEGAEAARYLDEPMTISVAFVVPAGGIEWDEVWVEMEGLNPVKVPVATEKPQAP